MNTTVTATGFEALAAVHPKHVDTIRAHGEALRPGAVVEFALVRDSEGRTTTGPATFFTGVKDGMRVVVSDLHTSANHQSRTVQLIEGDASHLSVNSGMSLAAVDPADWTHEEALGAQRAATSAATSEMERALCSANGLLGAPTGDVAAVDALRRAHDLRNYAFACGILAEYIDGMERGDGYHVGSYLRATA